MRLENPYLLLLALPALAAVFFNWMNADKRRAALTYPLSILKGIALSRSAVRLLPLGLKTLALLLVVAALARPQKVLRQEAGVSSGVDIMMVLDTSISMRALDFDPLDRMAAAKNAARSFIGRRVSDRIGMVVFAGIPILACPLTLDTGALLEFLDGVESGMTQADGTAVGDGLASGVAHLKDSRAKSKVLILLTDGANNTGTVDPQTAARAAAAYGIKVYTIGTGRRGPALIPVDDPRFGRRVVQIPDELDEDALISVAAQTGGRYYRAETVKQLEAIYAEIDRLEKTDLRLPPILSYTDLHARFLVPAALLLAGGMLLSRTLLMRLP